MIFRRLVVVAVAVATARVAMTIQGIQRGDLFTVRWHWVLRGCLRWFSCPYDLVGVRVPAWTTTIDILHFYANVLYLAMLQLSFASIFARRQYYHWY